LKLCSMALQKAKAYEAHHLGKLRKMSS